MHPPLAKRSASLHSTGLPFRIITALGFFVVVLSASAQEGSTTKPAVQTPSGETPAPKPAFHDATQLQSSVTVNEWLGDAPRGGKPSRSSTFDVHYLAYGQMPNSGTFEVALRATLRPPGAEPFVHVNKPHVEIYEEGPEKKRLGRKDRILFMSLDELNRVDSVFAHWDYEPFSHLQLSPVPPLGIDTPLTTTQSSERLHLSNDTYVADLAWTVSPHSDGLQILGKLTRPCRPVTGVGPHLTAYTMWYQVAPDGVLVKYSSDWSLEKEGKPHLTVRISSDRFNDSNLPEEQRFPRRAELATTKGQMRFVHPGGDLDERKLFASMLRDRLIGSPYQTVTLDMFDDYIESVRPLAAKFQAQLAKLEARYEDLLPDFLGTDGDGTSWDLSACSGTPTVILAMATPDQQDNERLLSELEPLRRTYGDRLRVIVLTREPGSTDKSLSTLGQFLKDEGVTLPLVAGQRAFFDELGLECTPTVLLVDDQGILKSSIVGYPPRVGIEKLKLNLQSILR